MRTAAGADAVEGGELAAQRVFKQHVGPAVAALSVDLRPRYIAPAERRQRHERLQLLATGF